jgi:RHS repeat-associated protein
LVLDADNNRTTYTYDERGSRTQMTDPVGDPPATYAYDSAMRVISKTDGLGRVTTYAYDADSREVGETWRVSSGGAITNILTFTYDGDGNLLSAANFAGTVSRSYDGDNRLASQTDVWGNTLAYLYDQDGNRTLVTDSLNGTTLSVYDGDNRLTSRQFQDSLVTAAHLRFDDTYTPQGMLMSRTRYTDTTTLHVAGAAAYTYYDAGRLNTLTQTGTAGGVLASYVYTYDNAGLLATERDNGASTITYGYDNADQVTADQTSSGYTWDAAGNRTNSGFQGSGQGGTYVGNQLEQAVLPGPSGPVTWVYAYDHEGNLHSTNQAVGPEAWTYNYDNLNHLLSAHGTGTQQGTTNADVTYTYDALGNRVRAVTTTVTGSQTTVTTVSYAIDDQGNAWADFDSLQVIKARHFFSDTTDDVVARIDYPSGTVTWYLTDRQETVRDTANNSGTRNGHRDYTAFGLIVNDDMGTGLDRYGYTGAELEVTTGLQYNHWRWYDPATQRWTSRDPSEFDAGDGNLYRYVGNDATNATDPMGLQPPVYIEQKRKEAGLPPLPPDPPGPYVTDEPGTRVTVLDIDGHRVVVKGDVDTPKKPLVVRLNLDKIKFSKGWLAQEVQKEYDKASLRRKQELLFVFPYMVREVKDDHGYTWHVDEIQPTSEKGDAILILRGDKRPATDDNKSDIIGFLSQPDPRIATFNFQSLPSLNLKRFSAPAKAGNVAAVPASELPASTRVRITDPALLLEYKGPLPTGANSAIPKASEPVIIGFPVKKGSLNAIQQQAFIDQLAEQEAQLNSMLESDLRLNRANYQNNKELGLIDRSRRLANQYLGNKPSQAYPGQEFDAAHALDSVAGGYKDNFIGYRDRRAQQYIGSLWRDRQQLIQPGQQHRLVPLIPPAD